MIQCPHPPLKCTRKRTYRSISRRCVKCRYTCRSSRALLRNRPLRRQLQTQIPLQIHLLEHLVVSNITRNHSANLLGFQQLSQPNTRHSRIIADHCEVCEVGTIAERVDERVWYARETETADEKGRVGFHVFDGFLGGGDYLVDS
jgi:hypothetical protein